MVGMRHLQPAVIGFELAGDQPPASFRQQPLEIGRVGLEIDELERGARLVLDQHAIGTRAAAAPPARPPGRCSVTVTSSVASSPTLASVMRGAMGRSITETGKCHTRSITRACPPSWRGASSLFSRPSTFGPTPFNERTVANRGAKRGGRTDILGDAFVHQRRSCPALCRASTNSSLKSPSTTRMAGTKPGHDSVQLSGIPLTGLARSL